MVFPSLDTLLSCFIFAHTRGTPCYRLVNVYLFSRSGTFELCELVVVLGSSSVNAMVMAIGL